LSLGHVDHRHLHRIPNTIADGFTGNLRAARIQPVGARLHNEIKFVWAIATFASIIVKAGSFQKPEGMYFVNAS
jgi:hypothetical protein